MKIDAKCKLCRRAGEKLFLKGERCYTPKCAMVKKAYPPGIHGRSRSRGLSEYGIQLRDKQKVRHSYNITERQLRRYFKEASGKKGSTPLLIIQALERRLDNVLYRLGIAKSRIIARQIISHGHITVNGKKVDIPSYQVKVDDRIGIRSKSVEMQLFKHLEKQKQVKQSSIPSWLAWDANKREGMVKALPTEETGDFPFNIQNIIEFYSR